MAQAEAQTIRAWVRISAVRATGWDLRRYRALFIRERRVNLIITGPASLA